MCVFAGVVPEPEGQVAQTGEDGGGKAGPKRLRALNDDRFAEPDAGVQPGAARRPVAVTTAAVRVTRFLVAPADGLPELPDAAGCALRPPVVLTEVAAITATADHHRHSTVVVVDVHVFIVRGVHCRPQDIVHSCTQAQG